jgi:hypothetical protein
MSRGDPGFEDVPPKGSLQKFYVEIAEHPEIEKRIREEHTFSWKYQVPYLAGSSWSGKKVYLDPRLRGLPKWAIRAIILHEVIEWALDVTGKSYETRHHMATAVEDQFVEFSGYTAQQYRRLLHPFYKPVEHEKVTNAPPDLNLEPYSGKLKAILESFQEAAKKITKESADYGKGTWHRRCALCTMFREPHSCTLVEGRIDADDVCKYFKRAT